ncbi:MAG: hypothetical protein ACFFE5_07970 [Candidatus Thorarchaeota archaeon]
MNNKFSHETQAEINEIMKKIRRWEHFFEFQTEFYFNGWAISLREKNLYPRYIIIFKSYDTGLFSIKSFEIHLKNYQKEEYKEIYSDSHIDDANSMLEELKDIIYGKDLIEEASKIYKNAFIN